MPVNPVQEKLHALFISYSRNLPKKIADIEQKWAELANHFDEIELQNLHRQVHSLCGSAGTYGYKAVGETARRLEVYLKSILNAQTLTEEQQHEINHLLNELKKVVKTEQPVETSDKIPIKEQEKYHIVYIIDATESFFQTFKNLSEPGYVFSQFTDIVQLRAAIKDNKPEVLIVNVDKFNDRQIDTLNEIQKEQVVPIPLICTSFFNDTLTRLKAVRMGNSAFLQKPMDEFYLKETLDQVSGKQQAEAYRILIIDDSQSLAEYFALVLEEVGMVAHYITNPLLLIQTIEEFQPDLLLMDIYMPECTGLELAAILRQDLKYTKLPIIFLSTEDDRLKQLFALNMGGDDFLTKPILPNHLIEAVRSRAKRAGILKSMMMRDSLTNLLNHTAVLQQLDIELARAIRKSEPLCFIMIDIDKFKSVNDKHGHPAGDKVLKSLANLLSTTLRKSDLTGRYGGEEFVLILPNTDKDQGMNICNALREKFAELCFHFNASDFHATFSAGIASFPEHSNAKNLISSADKALYIAKENGRNQVVLAD